MAEENNDNLSDNTISELLMNRNLALKIYVYWKILM